MDNTTQYIRCCLPPPPSPRAIISQIRQHPRVYFEPPFFAWPMTSVGVVRKCTAHSKNRGGSRFGVRASDPEAGVLETTFVTLLLWHGRVFCQPTTRPRQQSVPRVPWTRRHAQTHFRCARPVCGTTATDRHADKWLQSRRKGRVVDALPLRHIPPAATLTDSPALFRSSKSTGRSVPRALTSSPA